MRFVCLLAPLSLIALPFTAAAQQQDGTVVTSAGPDTAEVSIYRNPYPSAGDPLDLEELRGFALVTETREVDLPPGPVTVRFEGVASGIEPASALVRGVGIEEKNQDARLLSQRGLLDAFTGQRVIVRRTDPATGAVSEETGTIISDPDRVILRTAEGFEPLYCTGLDQTILFPSVPRDLTAKPTLSVAIGDQPGGRTRITLTYLAANFDWQANYVAELNADGSKVDLLGWLTMASADSTSFVNADANAIAGRVNKEERARQEEGPYSEYEIDIAYSCWPYGTTSNVGSYSGTFPPPPPPPPPAPAPMMMRSAVAYEDEAMSIVVTGSRIAVQEALGDLKLYRIPFPVTVAANSQKQVAFLSKRGVEGEIVYRTEFYDADAADDIERIFRMENEKKVGLGEPMPSGQFAFFQQAAGTRQLVGEASMSDKAVGEEIELVLGEANNVTIGTEYGREGDKWEEVIVTVKNANAFPIVFESRYAPNEDERLARFSERTFDRNGRKTWRVTVPANGSRVVSYRVYEID